MGERVAVHKRLERDLDLLHGGREIDDFHDVCRRARRVVRVVVAHQVVCRLVRVEQVTAVECRVRHHVFYWCIRVAKQLDHQFAWYIDLLKILQKNN